MTVPFTRFGSKDLTTKSDTTVINNNCSSVSTVLKKRWWQLHRKLNLLSCLYVSLSCNYTRDLSATILFKLVDSYLTAFKLHNNVASIRKNRGDKSHRVIVALVKYHLLPAGGWGS